jgi:hypothetical protein
VRDPRHVPGEWSIYIYIVHKIKKPLSIYITVRQREWGLDSIICRSGVKRNTKNDNGAMGASSFPPPLSPTLELLTLEYFTVFY